MSNELATVGQTVAVQAIVQKLEIAVIEANALKVDDQLSLSIAANYFKSFKDTVDELEEIRLAANKPFSDIVKANNAYIKDIQNKTFDPQDRLNKQMVEYRKLEEQKRIEEQRQAQKAAEEAALKEATEREARAKAFAKANNIDENKVVVETPFVPAVEIKAAPKFSQMNSSGIKEVRVPKWRVVDELKIPDRYWILDEKVINAERRARGVEKTGLNYIPGIEFYNDTDIK